MNDDLYYYLIANCSTITKATTENLLRGRNGVEKYLLSEEVGKLQSILEIMADEGLLDKQTVNRNYLKFGGKYKRELNYDR